MLEDKQRVEESTVRSGNTVQKTTEIRNTHSGTGRTQHTIARVVWYIADVILILLGLRFVLSLLGANTTNAFANCVYTVSYPFVAPFFGLFSHDQVYGVAHIEIYTLVAMAVYALVAWGIARLITLTR